ncbi:MAG: alpha/beta fold hydrolase [Caulobacteraceae bacterium]|nr:alpha/beta fold hydrolase [Caulobacteraceae bacterium]
MRRFEVEIGAQAVSGIRAGEGGTRGLVIALHGGGYDAHYWHAADRDGGSLLSIGAAVGFEVVAIHRPGYSGSPTPGPEGLPLADQADLVFSLAARLAPHGRRPVFLVGHSMGGILAVRMAGDARGPSLGGVDVSGVPLRYPAEVEAGIAARLEPSGAGAAKPASRSADERAAHRRSLFYGAEGTYDAELAERSGGQPTPLSELMDAFRAPSALPPIMADIAIPVQWTIAEEERSTIGGPEMLDYIRSLLPRCPHLGLSIQVASGHNISLHHVARAYHLRALAFFEECRVLASLPARGG